MSLIALLEKTTRALATKARAASHFDIQNYCFDKQLEFIFSPARFKTAVCSRRSGKTVACAAHMIYLSTSKSNQVCLYITLSRSNAKKIIWAQILEINREYSLGGITNETELSIRFHNGSVIYLSGAHDKTEIEKFRGLAISLCYLDECQSFKPFIEDLVEQVITKALFDYNGTLCMIGTPGPVPVGYFYDCSHSKAWEPFAWNMLDNPYLEKKSGKKALALIHEDIHRKGVTIDDPTIQRECFGKWVVDPNVLVFKYSPQRNHYRELPQLATPWETIIGVDLGFDDSDAIAVIQWNEQCNQAYLVEEIIRDKQGITDLAIQIDELVTRYKPIRIVMDTGGLGKKIAEEITKRYGIHISAAEKSRKFEYIELLNDALRTSRLYAKQDSRFAFDCMKVEWDRDSQNLKVNESYHSDICDAVLYAFRESLHWLHVEPLPQVKYQSSAWYEKEVRIMEEHALELVTQMGEDNDYGS